MLTRITAVILLLLWTAATNGREVAVILGGRTAEDAILNTVEVITFVLRFGRFIIVFSFL